jgi:hypothetical protein
MNLWSQIGNITLKDTDGSDCYIFEGFGEYVVPINNLTIQSKARFLYRAIGRIISYCILHEHCVIANHVMVSTDANS